MTRVSTTISKSEKPRRKPAKYKGLLKHIRGETLNSIVFSNIGYIYSKVKPNLDPINVDQIHQLRSLLNKNKRIQKTHEDISTLNLTASLNAEMDF